MDEAQYLADRVAVIAAGQLVAEGTPGSIGGRETGSARIRFLLPDGLSASALPVSAHLDGGHVVVESSEPTRTLHLLTGWALDRGVELRGLTVSRPSLEDVYLELVGR
jgi:ABC-2 type transport system ATP-binding protein